MQHSPYVNAVPHIVAEMQEGQECDHQPAEGEAGYHAYPVTLGDVQGVLYTQEPVPPAYLSSTVIYEGEQPGANKRPFFFALCFSLVALFILLAIGVTSSYQQPEVRETLHVPAILLPLKTFHTSVTIIPTGRQMHPATTARGTLTITNGSILSEELPQGMTVTSSNGVEIVTDEAVFIPPGSAAGYGFATVSAHAVIPGSSGNIPPLAINQVEGTALYIRNLRPFTGGHNAFTTTFITPTDRANALSSARTRLKAHTFAGILFRPCAESITGNQTLYVTWSCQFVTYHIPSYMRVTGVHVQGRYLLINVVFVARPRPFPGK